MLLEDLQFENRVPLKPVLVDVGSVAPLNYCTCTDSIKSESAIFVSSMCSLVPEALHSELILLIHARKRIGPRTEPCWMPEETWIRFEFSPLITTNKSLIHCKVFPLIPQWSSPSMFSSVKCFLLNPSKNLKMKRQVKQIITDYWISNITNTVICIGSLLLHY